MKKTDITSGRIIQRVLDEKSKNSSEVIVVHGVDFKHDVNRLVHNLLEYFPHGKITLGLSKFGYELTIEA